MTIPLFHVDAFTECLLRATRLPCVSFRRGKSEVDPKNWTVE